MLQKVLRSKRKKRRKKEEKKWKKKKIYYDKKRKVRKKGKIKKKEKGRKREKWKGNNKDAPQIFMKQCLDDKSTLKSSNHVHSDNEDMTRASGSSICHLHMSTYLNVCVSSLSFSNIYFPWPFWRVSVIPIDLSLNLTIFRMYVLLGLFLTF
jgi:hypothetical protein